jgi:hypothetical protein
MRKKICLSQNYPKLLGNYLALFLVCLLFFTSEVYLQWTGGAFRSEFGGHPDEAGHYVTGLMVRDYIADFQLFSPIEFAENYYIHYPKVAMGHWPPFFYVVQAAWTLPFSPSRASVLLLMALLTTLLAGIVYLAIRSEFGSEAGITIGLLLIALPLIQIYSKMVMAEILVALLSFCAVLYFGRFLDTEKWKDSAGFGICAALAILTKGNGLALVLVPPLALLFTRRFHLLTRPSFWCPAVIVLVFCGPFYWITLDMVRNGWQDGAPNLKFTMAAIRYYSYQLTKIIGIGLSLLVAIGFVMRVIRSHWDRGVEGKWAAVGALLLSVWLFQCVVPSGLAARHLITAAPALLMFLAAGIAAVADQLPLRRLTDERKVAILALAAALVFGARTFAIPKNSCYGFAEVAHQLLSTPDFQQSVFLVSSDSNGEGMFISEVAMREQRPGHIVLRASKVLSTSRWDGKEYEMLYQTPEQIMSYLEEIQVEILVLDLSVPIWGQFEHHLLLKETLKAYPQRWELLGTYSLTRQATEHPDALQVYRLVGHEKQPMKPIRVDMRKMLGKILEKTTEK